MKQVIITLVIISIISTGIAYADHLDLENTILSDNDKIILQFGENKEQHLYSKTIVTPILEHGSISVSDRTFSLTNSQVRIMGDSFRIVAFEDQYNILIYAQNMGHDNFNIRVYIYEPDTDTAKFTFVAILNQL